MIPKDSFWRRLYRIIRANVNHYRYRPKKIEVAKAPKKIKVVSKYQNLDTPYILSAWQVERLAARKVERAKQVMFNPTHDVMREDIRTYQRAMNTASLSRNDPHNYYHRER